MSAKGIVAGGETAKKVTQATGGAAKGAKTGLGGQAKAAGSGASSTAAHASSGATSVAGSVSTQLHSTAHSATATGNKTVSSYSGKVKASVGKVKSKLQGGMTSTKAQMDAHATKVQGGTQKIPGENQSKVSEGQAKVNAAASKEPEKPKGIWGHIVSAAKWVAQKLKAAFEFVTKLLTDPGFWVSLIVFIALAAFVVATFGTGLAVIVIGGAIVGAIAAGAGTVTSNLVAGRKWNDGLVTSMVIGGILGPLGMPGAGGVLAAAGSSFMRTAAGRSVASLGTKLANSFAGRAISAVAQRIAKSGAAQAVSKFFSRAGSIVSAPFRKLSDLATRAGIAVRRRDPAAHARAACPIRWPRRAAAGRRSTPTTRTRRTSAR